MMVKMADTGVLKHDRMMDHWRCLLSCSVVALSAMLYGGDVIIIDTLQAMPGFLEVGSWYPKPFMRKIVIEQLYTGLWK